MTGIVLMRPAPLEPRNTDSRARTAVVGTILFAAVEVAAVLITVQFVGQHVVRTPDPGVPTHLERPTGAAEGAG